MLIIAPVSIAIIASTMSADNNFFIKNPPLKMEYPKVTDNVVNGREPRDKISARRRLFSQEGSCSPSLYPSIFTLGFPSFAKREKLTANNKRRATNLRILNILTFSKNCSSNSNQSRTFFNSNFKIRRHSHRKLC